MNDLQVGKALASYPILFGLSLERKLKPTSQWLNDLGMDDLQVAETVARSPQLCGYSLDKNLKPRFALLEQQVSAGKLVDFVKTRGSSWFMCKMADCSDRIQSSL
mmetsp:Transcript_33385/g.106405  ORF Transcript_33385/g.106405 Transcript_33385/m.106405 type:complete len:105 (+) Transcript_33385:69-383(+)